ncbi:putative helicase mov-10-B.1 [Centruroides vittatus]|uniref:putative helicase mov-10-B.1 n=1 Tax=Centruroides vittatus TaxID=120091 RepID=UPI00350F4C6F
MLPSTHLIKGVPPKTDVFNCLEKSVALEKYSIPNKLRKIVFNNIKKWESITEEEAVLLDSIRKRMKHGINSNSYSAYFSFLLYCEEIQLEEDIKKYSMTNSTMTYIREDKVFLLEVPGLMENKPPIVKGNSIYVRSSNNTQNLSTEYEGRVHKINKNTVVLRFSKKFLETFIDGMRFDIRFSYNKYNLQLMHRALKIYNQVDISPLLFPTAETAAKYQLRSVREFVFFNKNIESNPEQATAVEQIVLGSSYPAPYLLFGPPGTGKTVTLVEAIKQLWKLDDNTKILVCAPANSAADLITERIIKHVPLCQVFRMYASSRSLNLIPEKLKECSNIDSIFGKIFYPSCKSLMQYRIIVTTLVTAGRLVSAALPCNHFTHIFIDEAGNSSEPETIISISGLIKSSIDNPKGGHLILAGDPKQLGPVVASKLATKYGLGMSLLERLMNIEQVYGRKENVYNKEVLTKLLKNYRSHPSILKLPNELFYDNELEVCRQNCVCDLFCNWTYLPSKCFPIIFHGVIGHDEREPNDSSYFNPKEISVVVNYVEKLLESTGDLNLSPKDIGIISPYRKQVDNITNKLKLNASCDDISVGSVEEFQGQERKAIIISTVRSNPNPLAKDHKLKLGFLKEPKRFNVAVTRAKALLIIIGNPFNLSKDKNWNRVLEYCCDNKSYCGAPYVNNNNNDEIDDIIRKMSNLRIDDGKKSKEKEVNEEQEEE